MAGFWSGRPGWLGKLGIVLLITWLLVLILSVSHVLKNNSSSLRDAKNGNKENTMRLAQMANDFEVLRRQNEVLRNIVIG